MPYFTQFQKSSYPLSDTVSKNLTNISHYTAIFSRLADDASFYTYYNARGDERFDTISNELYGTTDYYWTIPILNAGIINTWKNSTKSEQALKKFLDRKYPGVALIIDPVDDLVGKFEVGEIVAYDINNVYRVLNKYPSLRYIHCEPVSMDEFDVLNDPQQVWVLLTGLWNEANLNIWDDTDIWRDNTDYVVGRDTLTAAKVESSIPAYKAPAYYLDVDGNRVPWYKGINEVTFEDVEREKNEEYSRIKVIRPEFIYDIAAQFEREMA